MPDEYTGPVCYVGHDQETAAGLPVLGGWHYTVVAGPDGSEIPGERLVCEDNADGSAYRFRLATDADTRSWHDRKHAALAVFQTVPLDDEEQAALDTFRKQREGAAQ